MRGEAEEELDDGYFFQDYLTYEPRRNGSENSLGV